MNKSKNKHFNFLSKRQNRYSIRRFSAGIASVLVGTAFFLGAHTSDASAAEQDTVSRATQKSQDSSNTSDLSIETIEKTTQAPTTEVNEVNVRDKVTQARIVEPSQTTEQNNKATMPEIPTNETDNLTEAPVKEKMQDAQATDIQKNEDQNIEPTATPKKSKETESSNEAHSTEGVKTEETNQKDKAKTEAESIEKTSTNTEVAKKEKGATKKQTTESSSSEKSTKEMPTHQLESPPTEIPINQTPMNTEQPQHTEQQFEKLSKETNFDNMDPATKTLYLEDLKDYADKQDALKTATTVSTRNKPEKIAAPKKTTWARDVVPEDEVEIPADAIANGYIRTGTDATNAAHTLSGRAWMIDHGTVATMANGLTAVPEGTKVHLRWIDKDGATSPIYTARTTNKLSVADGSQVGPGAYAFDLRKGWTDAKGKHHVYSAVKGQRYKIWIDDFTTKDGNVATMLRVAGGYFPGTYVDSVTHNNMGQFPLIGANMQRTGIFMTTIPSEKYLTSKTHINDPKGAAANPAVTMLEDHFISGKIWIETGDGDYANSVTGPNYNRKDIATNGYKVVMTSLTDQGAKAYDTQVNHLPQKKRAEAARKLLTEHPEYISVTIEGTTNEHGEYTLRFPKGTLNKDHIYGYVLDRNGKIVKTYSGFTSPEFRRPNYNLSVAPQTAPYYRPIRYAWVNVNFAVVETTQTQINITDFDVTSNPAHRGDTAHVDITGMPKTSLLTRVQWKDSSGKTVKDSGPVTSEKAAENKAKFMIPTNAKSGEMYTVQLMVGDHVIASDSLIVHVNEDAAKYHPVYPPIIVEPGQKATIPAPKNANGQRLPNGTTFEKGHHVPKWVTVNHDGSMIVNPGEKVAEGDYDIPVIVTYPDGSKSTILAPVTVQENEPMASQYEPTSGGVSKPFGTPVTSGDVTGSVKSPNYPVEGEQPKVTVDDESQLPNGTTEGQTDVDVTVTYPDGTKDHIKVSVVTEKQPDGDKYEPTSGGVSKPFGTAVTSSDVVDSVKFPNYPVEGEQPTVTVDDESQLPNGTTEGQTDVDVTVTYPDGTKDHIKVPVVTEKQPDGDKYEPTSGGVSKPFGTSVTSSDVTNSVKFPNYPVEGEQPKVTVDDESQLPDGTTEGQTDVDVTVTYPDGTKDHIKVPVVTEKQPDGDKYESTSGGVSKPFGTPVTSSDVTNSVKFPDYPVEGEQPTVTVDDESQLPNGTTEGQTDVDVTVTYPDGTKDHIKVPVVTEKQLDGDKYEPTSGGVSKPFGTSVTSSDVTDSVKFPDYPVEGEQPKVTVDDESQLPNGTTEGQTDVDVTVTYPDGTKDHIKVPVVTEKQLDSDKYDPVTTGILKPFGDPTTEEDVTKLVDVQDYPTDLPQPKVTVTDPSTLPDGQTPGKVDIDVTVTYPDGSTDHIKVPVWTNKHLDKDKYEPTSGGVSKPFGTPVTSGDVTDSVKFPNYPVEGEQPTVTVDDETQLPNGTTEGQTDVDVTVTYPDGTKDHIKVPVVTEKQLDGDKYEPTSGGVSKPFGTPVTSDDVMDSVKFPNYPVEGEQPKVTVDDESQLPNGTTEGQTDVDVTVTYPDGTKDHIKVPVVTEKQPDGDKYEPTSGGVSKPFGTPVTSDDVMDSVKFPDYPVEGEQPKVTVDDESQLPNGTTEGQTDVDVTVTYPDGTKDHIKVPVVTEKQPDGDKYEPTSGGISKPFGTPVTSSDVTDSVKFPNYPVEGEQPKVTVDDESQLPNGTTEGQTDVDVTVTYPDGTKDHIKVPVVTEKQPDGDKYEPTSGGVSKPFGTAVTSVDVIGSVKFPNYPVEGEQPTVTVDDEKQLPDGTVEGQTDVDVTVTYPDGTKDHIKVPVVTEKQPDNEKYEPTTTGITKAYGSPTTAVEVTGVVRIPYFPVKGAQPVVTVQDPRQLPSGTKEGQTNVGVTVTYPDGTKDYMTVPVVTKKQAENEKYDPITLGVYKEYGSPTTSADVTDAIQFPSYPISEQPPVVTVDDESQLPDGTTEGEVDISVTVTYPDGTKDHITVPIFTSQQKDNQKYEPTSSGVTKDYGIPTGVDDVLNAVTVTNYPANLEEQPMKTVDAPDRLPDGMTEGTVTVGVTVTYPDGTKDHIKVSVVTNPPADNVRFEPTTDGITKPFGEPTTAAEVTGVVKIPNFPTDGEQPVVIVTNPSQLPNGTKEGQTNVGVTVTYPDGTTDYFTVPVVTNKQPDSDKYEPTTDGITKPYGIPTTASEVLDAVKFPDYPEDAEPPVLTVKDPTQLPDGKVGATVDVSVAVIYPDGTTDEISVPVTTSNPNDEDGGHGSSGSSSGIPNLGSNGPTVSPSIKLPSLQGRVPHFAGPHVAPTMENNQPSDSDKYSPTSAGVTKAHGTPVTTTDVTDAVKFPNYPTNGEQPVVTVNDDSQLPDGTTDGTVDVGVEVTYPDGSTKQLTVPVTVESQATMTTVTKGHKTSTPATKDQQSMSDKVVTMPTVAHESQQKSHAVEKVAHVSTTMTNVADGEQEATDIATTLYAETNRPVSTSAQATDEPEVKHLPETGEDNKQAGLLLGGFIAVIAGLLLFGRRRNSKKD